MAWCAVGYLWKVSFSCAEIPISSYRLGNKGINCDAKTCSTGTEDARSDAWTQYRNGVGCETGKRNNN